MSRTGSARPWPRSPVAASTTGILALPFHASSFNPGVLQMKTSSFHMIAAALVVTVTAVACGGGSSSTPTTPTPPTSTTPPTTTPPTTTPPTTATDSATITIGADGRVSPTSVTIVRGGRVT